MRTDEPGSAQFLARSKDVVATPLLFVTAETGENVDPVGPVNDTEAPACGVPPDLVIVAVTVVAPLANTRPDGAESDSNGLFEAANAGEDAVTATAGIDHVAVAIIDRLEIPAGRVSPSGVACDGWSFIGFVTVVSSLWKWRVDRTVPAALYPPPLGQDGDARSFQVKLAFREDDEHSVHHLESSFSPARAPAQPSRDPPRLLSWMVSAENCVVRTC